MPRGEMRYMFTTTSARTNNQSSCEAAFAVVHSRCRKFLKHVHNLFTRRSGLLSPAGLRLEIRCETDKKKINFIFNCTKKIFLTKKQNARVPSKGNKQRISIKFWREPKHNPFGVALTN